MSAVAQPENFHQAVVDSLAEHLCVIDANAQLVYVNRSWLRFWQDNGGGESVDWRGQNYLLHCESAAARGDEVAQQIASGLRALIGGRRSEFTHEYPCDSPSKKRWFLLEARPLAWNAKPLFVLSHTDITQRKRAEQAIEEMSQTDQLTGLANRRHFDEFIGQQWFAHMRRKEPLGLVMVDIDHFKRFNDRHGHLAGDECLRRVAGPLVANTQRALDLAARYGGEEFALVLGQTGIQAAVEIAERVRQAVRRLGIAGPDDEDERIVTVSAGAASMVPRPKSHPDDLVRAADQALYAAKEQGRDRVVSAQSLNSAAA